MAGRAMFEGHGHGHKASNWGEMYIHQQLKHLLDTGSDYIFSKQSWWLPTLAVASCAAVLLFSGPAAVPQLMQVASAVLAPVPGTSTFGQEMPQAPGRGDAAAEDDDDEGL